MESRYCKSLMVLHGNLGHILPSCLPKHWHISACQVINIQDIIVKNVASFVSRTGVGIIWSGDLVLIKLPRNHQNYSIHKYLLWLYPITKVFDLTWPSSWIDLNNITSGPCWDKIIAIINISHQNNLLLYQFLK